MKDRSNTIWAASIKQREIDTPCATIFEVTVPGAIPTVYRLANFDRDLVFDQTSTGVPLVWQHFDCAMGDFTDTKSGDLSQIQIGISNITREFSALVDEHVGFGGSTVRIMIVNTAALSDVSAKLLFVGKIVKTEVDEKSILFTLGQPSLARAAFPARRSLTRCGVIRFGDEECGYPIPASPTNAVGGGFSFCPKDVPGCSERGADEVARGLVQLHPLRFNGYPGIAPGNE